MNSRGVLESTGGGRVVGCHQGDPSAIGSQGGIFMGTVMDLAERMWTGEVTTDEHHPWTPVGDIEEIAEKTIF